EAKEAADAVLASADKDERDYRLATMAKSMALDLQAERLAQTRQQRVDLLLEAERWGAPIEQHKNGAPPRARVLSPAQKSELESQALRRWASVLLDALPKGDTSAAVRHSFDDADGMLTEAEKLTPNDPDLIDARAGWLTMSADRFETDPARAAAKREQAKRLQARAQQLRSGKRPVVI